MYDFNVVFNATDNISKKIKTVNSNMANMRSKFANASKKVKLQFTNMNLKGKLQFSTKVALQKLRVVRQKISQLGTGGKNLAVKGIQSLVAGAGFMTAILQPLNVARKYELAFRDVKKSVRGTPEELKNLRKELKSFGGASFEELSAVTVESGKMGFNAKNVMGFAKSVVRGAKALDFDAKVAVGQVGKILSMTNQMTTAVASGEDIMNKVVHLENRLAGVKGAGIIDVWKRGSDIYSQLNFDNTTMGGMSAFLEQTSVSSELAASGFKIMINRFKKLEGEFGFIKRIKSKGIAGVKDVMDEIRKMTPEEAIKKFGPQAMTLINKLLNKKNIAKLDFAMKMSSESDGAVSREWKLFRATFDQKLQDVKKAIGNMMDALGIPMIRIATSFINFIIPIINKMENWIKENKELASSFMKWGAILGGVLAVFGVLAIVIGVVGMAVGVLSTGLTVITSGFGMITAVTWAYNTALWGCPVIWIILGFVALVAIVVTLIYYWKDISKWTKKLWKDFTGFLDSLNLVENSMEALEDVMSSLNYYWEMCTNWVSKLWDKFKGFLSSLKPLEIAMALIGASFRLWTAPLRYVIKLFDMLLSKFSIYKKAKAKITNFGGSLFKEGVEKFKNLIGFGSEKTKNSDSNFNNKNKDSRTVIDLNILAPKDVKLKPSIKENGKKVNLTTKENERVNR